MKLTKVQMTKDDWCIEINDNLIIPIMPSLYPILICLILVDCMLQFGSYTGNIVSMTAYMAEEGMYNPEDHTVLNCRPELDNSFVKWNCNLKNDSYYGDEFTKLKWGNVSG